MRNLLLLATLTAAPLAHAQEFNGGVLGGLTLPVGDLQGKNTFGTNSVFGIHVGGHLDINFTQNHQLRPQISYHILPGSRWGNGVKTEFRNLQLGADYVYNFESPNQGWYFLAGAHLNNLKAEYDGTVFVPGFGNVGGFNSSASQSSKFGQRVGGGYTFNRTVSLEGHYNRAEVNKFGSDGFGFDEANWVQISAVIRFK
jgi:Outer membrane protein beta-barrel domain